MQFIRQTVASRRLPKQLEALLPLRLVEAVERCTPRAVEELRLHAGRVATVTVGGRNFPTGVVLDEAELSEILKRMCEDSLYAYGESICRGFVTLVGGIRVGVGGTAAIEDGRVIGVRHITALTVRIPHRIAVNTDPIIPHLITADRVQSMLIYSPPAVGKTTLLRALTEKAASPAHGIRTVAVDTREELGFGLEGEELTLDVLRGYPRALGIEIAVRCMGAGLIVCDEIGNGEDADALLSAANCGTAILASAHADSLKGLLLRPTFSRLHRAAVFDTYVGIRRRLGQFEYEVTRCHSAEEPIGS